MARVNRNCRSDRDFAQAVRESVSSYKETDRYTNGEKKDTASEEFQKRSKVFSKIVRVLEEQS